jgi:hypothetical protein
MSTSREASGNPRGRAPGAARAAGSFPGAERYAAVFRGAAGGTRESRPAQYPFPYTERHLQCVWFDPAHRPKDLRTDRGESVSVEDPGRWNLEAGPDFLDAALVLGPERRMLRGDVELHLHPSDWTEHRHGQDPRYARVIAHVTYYPGTPRAGAAPDRPPRGAIRIALRDALRADPSFSFENIDTAAYPYAARTPAPPCARILARWPPERVGALLDAAGEERLRAKSLRLRAAVEEDGAEQALYEEILAALGYKQNRPAFRRLARIAPVALLRDRSGGDPHTAYALLLGASGLLPDDPPAGSDAETGRFLRLLWDRWWRNRSEWEHAAMPAAAWRLSGLRPQNHPVRRLAAAASLFCPAPDLPARLPPPGGPPREWMERTAGTLAGGPPLEYWRRRLTFGGKRRPRDTALLGGARLGAILSSVVVPFLAAAGRNVTPLLPVLPPEQDNSLIRHTAASLLGRDHNPAIYRRGLRQQGLLQVFYDFCVASRAACGECPFAAALDRFPRS